MNFRINGKKFLPHQREWWLLQNFIKLLVGGYGCGKTYIGALRAIYLSYVHQGLYGQYVSPTYKMQKKTIIPTLRDIFTRSGLQVTHNKTDGEFTIHNWNGHIWLGSGDDPDSLRGPNLAWAGIDEPFIQDKEVLNQMLARVRVGESGKREIFLTGTPEQLNWGYDLYVNDGNHYDVGVVFGKTRDNAYISEDYYNTIYNAYTPEMREAYLNGKFINLREGKVYKPFDREKHIIHKDIDGLEICAGQDFNVDYMTSEVFALGNGWMHFIDEIRLGYSNSFEAAEILAHKYPGVRVWPDPTGGYRKSAATRSDHAIFQERGFRVHSERRAIPVMDRVNAVNKLLMNGHFTIEPGRCEWLIRDLERNTWKSGDINKDEKEMTHAGDAAGYAVHYLYPVISRKGYVVG